jgi:hypothetical protein
LRKRLCNIASNPENYTYIRAQTRIVAGEIDEINTPKRNAQVESLSHYVTSSMLRKLIHSGHKSPDLRETPQIIVMWAATSDMAAKDIPYPLQRLCKSWQLAAKDNSFLRSHSKCWQLAPQQEGYNLQQDLIGIIYDHTARQFNDQLYDIRRTKCTCPDCKLNHQ